MIYKVRGTCKRYGVGLSNIVNVTLSSELTLNGKRKAARWGNFLIATNGAKHTWYMPVMHHGGRGCGVWKGRNTVVSVSPPGVTSKGATFGASVNKCL